MTDLDDAYANAAHIPGADEFIQRWPRDAEEFRQSLGGRATLDVSYGDSPRQAYDLFAPEESARGTLIFVHGGYWLRFDRSFWSHLAEGAVTAGWQVAMPSYDLCPDVTIAQITQQIRGAVIAIADRTDGDIVLTGHSAGGHLVSRMLAPGMLPDEVLSRVRHVIPISPVSDLRPLLRTSMNAQFKLDKAKAEAESPVLQPAPMTPVTVVVGADERPAFLDQARWLADAWGCASEVIAGKHHFDIIDDLMALKGIFAHSIALPKPT